MYCTTTGQRLPDTPAEIRRLMIDQWATPILFRETIETMYADGIRVFLEVGPRGNLTGFVDDILAGRDYTAIPCNLTSRGGLLQLLHALALLCAHHVPVNLDRLYARRNPARLPLSDGEAPSPVAKIRQRPVKLKMDIPLMTLDTTTREQLRDCLISALGCAPSVLSSGFPESSIPPAAASALMQTHIQTLDQILSTHEEMMLAMLLRPEEPSATSPP